MIDRTGSDWTRTIRQPEMPAAEQGRMGAVCDE